jgi:hypothetical protein
LHLKVGIPFRKTAAFKILNRAGAKSAAAIVDFADRIIGGSAIPPGRQGQGRARARCVDAAIGGMDRVYAESRYDG